MHFRIIYLIILLSVVGILPTTAQSHFSKLYTLESYAATFNAVIAHGKDGGFITSAAVVDSTTKIQAIRICRLDTWGNLMATNYFNVPDTSRRIFLYNKAITKVNDNYYAIVGCILDKTKQYSFLLVADSNGKALNYKEITFSDSVNAITDVQYDGYGNLIVGGKSLTSTTSDLIVSKLDTSLNVKWLKSYHLGVLLGDQTTQNIVVDSTGYMLCGGAQNTGLDDMPFYKCLAFLFKVDTSGVQKWIWTSPTATYSDYYGHIASALHTLDGGYLFTTMGKTYNRLLPSDGVIRLYAKQVIVKLDSARNKKWEIVIDDYFMKYGYQPSTLIELRDSTFLFSGYRVTDSTAPNYQDGILVFQHYNQSGKLIYQKTINSPKDLTDTSKDSGAGFYDFTQTADAGFVFAGTYINNTIGAAKPTQRAWALKLDSNGCLGPTDPQCMLSIPPVVLTTERFSIYPNPNSGTCYISKASLRGKQSEPLSIKVYDLLGRVVYEQSLILNKAQTLLELNLAKGTYILELRTEEAVQRERILIAE